MTVSLNESILITGTGRCGTTFLVALFTFLGMDTGFTRETLQKNIFDHCKAGLEKLPGEYKIIKNPILMFTMIEYILRSNQVPKLVIIPVRSFSESAESRYKNTEKKGLLDATFKGEGGLWYANTKEEQITIYNKFMSEYIQMMTLYDVPTKFIDFYRMTTNSLYLYESLKDVIDPGVTCEKFEECYREATTLCAR